MDLKKARKQWKKRKMSKKTEKKSEKSEKRQKKPSEKSKIIDSKSEREQAYQTEDHVLNFIYYSLHSFIRM